ncbi:MAG TPA: hypothetical protein VL971_05380 [Rhizomicrobium sp.]|nr:hypothetical protein [Rhizomicrobium sp.]
MYFADFSQYEYGRTPPTSNILNVGWLGKGREFRKGQSDAKFIDKLSRMTASPTNLYRGYHVCEFCPAPPAKMLKGGVVISDDDVAAKGNGEIRVNTVESGKVITYVAPVLIHHYIIEHNYLPPQQFIDAVNATP